MFNQRFLDSGIPIEFLNEQYRMLPEIREFPSNEFYGGKLKDSTERKMRTFPVSLESLSTNNHLFFDLRFGREAKVNHSYFNEAEMK